MARVYVIIFILLFSFILAPKTVQQDQSIAIDEESLVEVRIGMYEHNIGSLSIYGNYSSFSVELDLNNSLLLTSNLFNGSSFENYRFDNKTSLEYENFTMSLLNDINSNVTMWIKEKTTMSEGTSINIIPENEFLEASKISKIDFIIINTGLINHKKEGNYTQVGGSLTIEFWKFGYVNDTTAPQFTDIFIDEIVAGKNYTLTWIIEEEYPGVYEIFIDDKLVQPLKIWSGDKIQYPIEKAENKTIIVTINVFDQFDNINSSSVRIKGSSIIPNNSDLFGQLSFNPFNFLFSLITLPMVRKIRKSTSQI